MADYRSLFEIRFQYNWVRWKALCLYFSEHPKILENTYGARRNLDFSAAYFEIFTKNTHGTGCTLSSAIATYYSCGKTLKKSCEMAIKYVNHAIGTGPKYGRGHGPINHLNTINIKKNFR